MCRDCYPGYGPVRDAPLEPLDSAPPLTRDVPYASGEGAIYSPERLATVEGNGKGVEPELWRHFTVLP